MLRDGGGPGRGAGGRWRGLADNAQTVSTARLEAAAGPAGPGRGAGGWRQGQGGPRDRPLRAAGSRVAISRAGRRPPAHTAARPNTTGHAAAGNLSGQQATRRAAATGTHSGPAQQTQRSRPAPQGPGGSRIRPLGGSQRLFQRIWVPSEPRRWQASTTRAAMPASADLPHVRGSYCFFTPTSPSILRTPS